MLSRSLLARIVFSTWAAPSLGRPWLTIRMLTVISDRLKHKLMILQVSTGWLTPKRSAPCQKRRAGTLTQATVALDHGLGRDDAGVVSRMGWWRAGRDCGDAADPQAGGGQPELLGGG